MNDALRIRGLIVAIVGSIAIAACQSASADSSAETVKAAAALVRRVVPAQADAFVIEMIPSAAGKDVFEVESSGGKIVLRGNNGVSVASALGYYLKHYCHCDFSWCGSQMRLPAELPAVKEKVCRQSPHVNRTYFNYCTFGYSMPWWDWAEWQRAIDQLAMRGVNMPLAATGMEAIWYQTLLRFGFTDLEARSFLCSPGHLPWQLMQNIEGMDGPLPKSWIDSHAELGRKILQRQRELGMTPVQQGFSGHVPRLLKQKFPAAEMRQQPSWAGFPGVMQLDPLDPLFEKFGRAFIKEEIKLFGAGHRYAADPFHESKPPKPGGAYLTAVGRQVFKVMTDADPQATWIMQGWTNHRQIIEAVPKDRLLVLSIPGAGKGAYFGYPFLNCRYNNFGCRNTLHGDLRGLAANPFAAVVNAPHSNCRGTGLMMEGIYQNPVYVELAGDMIWRDGPVDVVPWLHDYARRRYGAESAAANQAWDVLLASAYAPGTSATEYSSIIAARPALDCKKSGPNEGFRIPYPPRQLANAWELLLADRNQLQASDAYRFDVADVTRQALSNLAQSVQKDVGRAHQAKDKQAFARLARQFLELLDDVDAICATRREYNFGCWIADARRWGATEAEKDLYERNAATLVTLWGPPEGQGQSQIFDYAWREWAGLIRTYYHARWERFFEHLAAHPDYKEAGLPQVYGRETLRANAFYSQLADWEIAWTKQRHRLPAEPVGDAVELSSRLLAKYRPMIDHYWTGADPMQSSADRFDLQGRPLRVLDRVATVNGTSRVVAVGQPNLRLFRCGQNAPRGTVLLLPGGGYNCLAIDHEGVRVAEFVNRSGYDVALLEYTVHAPDARQKALADALAAVALLRDRGKQLGLHTGSLGVMGFSAGGHLAARVMHQLGAARALDFGVLVYPAYLNRGQGIEPDVAPAPHDSTAVFALIADNDNPQWVSGAKAYRDACMANGQRVDFHLLHGGGHGFGLKPHLPPGAAGWPELLKTFLNSRK